MSFLDKLRNAFRNNKFRWGLVGLIYIISPIDLVPEVVLGPVGLMDDAIVLLLSIFNLYDGWVEANK